MRDHGGDPDRARQIYGEGDWLDLSTGINPVPYPVPTLPLHAWSDLPTSTDMAGLLYAARQAYQSKAAIVALAGAQAAIQLVPRLMATGHARVLGPTYNEHLAALVAHGWTVEQVSDPEDLAGADLATIVNPNNPDGRCYPPESLNALADQVGLLVVDESFADPEPAFSLAPSLGPENGNIVVLRSFGKFFGLAGIRLGFALAGREMAERIAQLAGPWAVSGPAIALGRMALADMDWQDRTRERLVADAARMDRAAHTAGWRQVGGTTLFRTYAAPDASRAQEHLAHAHIWTRIFPYSRHWIRLGHPGTEQGWDRLEAALTRECE
ncbi:threonine-phosphate decarboxylase CobD [Paracoccus aestuariivivens]|uniref:threonine-phosphate decarboxylase n=1 Tax=Paracoccus aestuariivivens TaxID=1820333 RepID=A0A6L6JCS2_9RHOB|nr:threonine-phosphate decarboxylase CobD [Paracoccus aestuariivivens]MTH79760.1 threonine-phosphate decarboxylase [Paracoccus aestuariivivens]